MSVKMRQIVEREISAAVVDALLRANYFISVDNGYDIKSTPTQNREYIITSMYKTDEEHLHVYKSGLLSTADRGWVFLVYGNDGWDVISDYSVNLESIIGPGTPVDTVVKKYED